MYFQNSSYFLVLDIASIANIGFEILVSDSINLLDCTFVNAVGLAFDNIAVVPLASIESPVGSRFRVIFLKVIVLKIFFKVFCFLVGLFFFFLLRVLRFVLVLSFSAKTNQYKIRRTFLD
mgnify:CR=1 FL=1